MPCLSACSEWPYEKPAAEVKRRKPKGHKHDREKPLRCGRVRRLCCGAWIVLLAASFRHPCCQIVFHVIL